MRQQITDTPVSDDPLGLLRTLPRPEPPPWLRDRVLAKVYAMERRKRRLIAAARCGAVASAVLIGGGGIVYLGWLIAR